MSEMCFYEKDGKECPEIADYKISFSRFALPPFEEREEVHFACRRHKKKLVRDVKNLYRGLNIETGNPRIRGVV